MNETTPAAKAYDRVGTALLTTAVLSCALQLLVGYLTEEVLSGNTALLGSWWFKWLAMFLPIYMGGIPAGLAVMSALPGTVKEPTALGAKNFFAYLLICFPVMYAGNIIGTTLSSRLSGGQAENALLGLAFDNSPLKIVVVVLVAPFLEEYLFRKQIIDRCRVYGEKNAIGFSAFAFGLFHMNLFQFFYAFGLGLVFAYVYARTNRLRYPVLMHMVINFQGAVLAPLLLSSLDIDQIQAMAQGTVDEAALMDMLPAMGAFMLYALVLMVLNIVGLVLLCKRAPKATFLPAEAEIPKGQRLKTVYGSTGVIFLTVFCVGIGLYQLMG